MTSILDEFEIFNSTFFYNWLEDELFNHIANFLRHLQQCLHLYCESELLDLLIIAFIDFVSSWFDDQFKFISLHDFSIALTKAFSFRKFVTISSIFISSESSSSQKQQEFKVSFEALKAEQASSTVQDIDIFDSIFTCKNRRFSDFAKFLKHFQHCQRLYRESDLLILLSICFDGAAFDIWYNKQNVMTSASLSEWIEVLRVEFVIFAKSISTIIVCMRCDQNFNIKETFRDHVREQHAKKHVKNFCLDINTVKLMCKKDEKSTVNDSFFAFSSQKSDISIATSKQIFESALILEIVISQKSIHFSVHTSKTVSESKKNKSTQCFSVSSKSSSRMFESKHQKTDVQKHSIVSSSLTSSTFNSVCESNEKSAIACSFSSLKSSIFSATQNLISNTKTTLQIDSSKRSNLSTTTAKITLEYVKNTSNSLTEIAKAAKIFAKSIANIRVQTAHIRVKMKAERTAFQISALEFASKSMKRFSIQQIAFARICKRCKQSFNFNNKFHEHIREHHARKSVKSLNLKILASEFTCKIKKKSTIECFSVSLASFTFSATSRSSTKIISQSLSSKCSNLSIATYKISSKSMKSAAVVCSFIFSSTSSLGSVRKHQKSHNEFYLIMNDLHRMFAETFKSFDLQQHQNRNRSRQNFDFDQFDRSCSTFSTKLYLTIENLFEMFDGKFRRKNSFQNQRNVFSRRFFSNQSRITVYFKFTVNQKSSINQDSKNSKSKSLNQHMFAKSIRTVFSKSLFEKSIKSSYKMSDVFCINLKLSVEISFFIFIFFRFLSIFLFVFAFVSIISTARLSCISVYKQVISIIDRVIQWN